MNIPPQMRTEQDNILCFAMIKCKAGCLDKYNKMLKRVYVDGEWKNQTYYDAYTRKMIPVSIHFFTSNNDLLGVAEQLGLPGHGSKAGGCIYFFILKKTHCFQSVFILFQKRDNPYTEKVVFHFIAALCHEFWAKKL